MNNSKIQHRKYKMINEKGIALPMVLILALIALAIVSVMIFIVIQGTRFSGFYKRYATARESGIGGAEIISTLVKNRGYLVVPGFVNYSKECNCGFPDVPGDNKFSDGTSIPPEDPYYCLCAKICDSTSDWPSNCSATMDPGDSPDMYFNLTGIDTTYDVASKIVGTTIGNSDLSGEELGGTCVACASSETTPQKPYLYRIEVNSESSGKKERSRLSILYAY